MALITLPAPIALGPNLVGAWASNSPGTGQNAFSDAVGEGVAVVFTAQDSVTVDVLTCSIQGISGTPTFRATIETVDTATGMPTGTLVTSSVVSDLAVATGLNVFTGLNAALTAGTVYAARVQYLSGATSASIRYAYTSVGTLTWPKVATNAAGAWTERDACAYGVPIGLGTSTTAYLAWQGLIGGATIADLTYTDASAVDEYGLRWRCPAKMRVMGIMAALGGPTSGSLHVVMTDTSGNEVGTTLKTYDTDLFGVAATEGRNSLLFANPFEATAGTDYVISIKSTSAGNLSIRRIAYATNAQLGQLYSPNWYEVQRANCTTGSGVAWTSNDDTFPLFWPLVDQIDDGAGGASTVPISAIRGNTQPNY